ncbi:MAG TPA: FAD-dependent thymidylate synthase [Chitinispirillaceae bacterium]|nr:FAD-dependent thymidylate synthase [Chitinispirillaceae bacterium]
MKIKGLAICPPPGASQNPSVTPELLASCLARYSRSNKGIESILQSIDWNDPDRSVDAIFKFVDYGHASISGMTGGIAMVVDNCSMFLAYKIFELAQLCDGQESSTRYIKIDASSLCNPEEIGIAPELADDWQLCMALSFTIYQELYATLDRKAQEDPSIIKYPAGASEKMIDRIRKNYALDRSRYFIPFATKTNAAYIMTARVWADVIKQLDSLPHPETRNCAALLREELKKFVPRLIKHSFADDASIAQAESLYSYNKEYIIKNGVATDNCPDKVFLSIENSTPEFLGNTQSYTDAFAGKKNRYSITGTTVRRCMVRVAWNNMAIAELRDLNRHRSGFRFSPLTPVGFYCPPGVTHPRMNELLSMEKSLIEKTVSNSQGSSFVYSLLLGSQVPFEHSTHLDKFIYEIELRTGLGAHFRYAEHLNYAYNELIKFEPDLKKNIDIGTAEPE